MGTIHPGAALFPWRSEDATRGGLTMGDKSQIQGEGNYDAAREFDAEERAFIKKGGVEKKAREAEQALDGPEGEELERARKETAERGVEKER
jgi:hypothetical protein